MDILILDDDKSFTKKLQKDFYEYFHFSYHDLTFKIKYDDFLNINMDNIDLAFIDIDLVICNGIDIAEKLRESFPQLIIIFVSTREELVFNTFKTGVFQFIRKAKYDYDIDIVFQQLEKYLQIHFNKKIIEVNKRKTVIEINNIQYILSLGREVIIKQKDREDIIKSTIRDVLDLFDSNMLIQVQRNFIVHFGFIKKVKNSTIITVDGKSYKIGRKYQKDFFEKYEEYLLQ